MSRGSLATLNLCNSDSLFPSQNQNSFKLISQLEELWQGLKEQLQGLQGYQNLKQAVNTVGKELSQWTRRYYRFTVQGKSGQRDSRDRVVIKLQILATPHHRMIENIATLSRAACEYHRRAPTAKYLEKRCTSYID